jgi:hypothetical protein
MYQHRDCLDLGSRQNVRQRGQVGVDDIRTKALNQMHQARNNPQVDSWALTDIPKRNMMTVQRVLE